MSNRVVGYALWLGVGSLFACSTSASQPTDGGDAIPQDDGAIMDGSSEATVEDAVTDSSIDLAACNRPPPPPAHECIGCPGERPGGNCEVPQRDGGIYGRCREEGELMNGKVVGAYCCNRGDAAFGKGSFIPLLMVNDAGTCTQTAPDDLFVCSLCGDGICAEWENRCNCAPDCS
jgi:hypothetical protein